MSHLGVDSGASKWKATRLDITGKPIVEQLEATDNGMPAAVYLDDDRVVFGSEALRAGAQNPDRLITNFKEQLETDRILATSTTGKAWTARDCVAAMYRHIIASVEQSTNQIADGVVLLVPASATSALRSASRSAVELAGLSVIAVAHEPTAAAIGADILTRSDGEYLAIDKGAYTIDLSLIKKDGDVVTVLNTRGMQVAGNHDTDRIFGFVCEAFEREHSTRPNQNQDSLGYLELREQCEQAKLTLSSVNNARIVACWDNRVTTVPIDRDTFQNLTSDLTDHGIKEAEALLGETSVSPHDLEGIFLFGGGSKAPGLAEAVKRRICDKVLGNVDPIFSGAKGAAILGRIERDRLGLPTYSGNTRLPPSRIGISEVVSRDVGVEVIDEKSDDLVLEPVLPRSQKIPCDTTRTFRLAHDHETCAKINVLEGTRGDRSDQAKELGSFVLDDLPPVSGEMHKIEVRMKVDRNNELYVSARDLISGKELDLRLQYNI